MFFQDLILRLVSLFEILKVKQLWLILKQVPQTGAWIKLMFGMEIVAVVMATIVEFKRLQPNLMVKVNIFFYKLNIIVL